MKFYISFSKSNIVSFVKENWTAVKSKFNYSFGAFPSTYTLVICLLFIMGTCYNRTVKYICIFPDRIYSVNFTVKI